MSNKPAGKDASQPELLLDRIDEICDQFESDWKAGSSGGRSPRIEDYVESGESAPDADSSRQLLIELVMIDLEYRHRQAESSSSSPSEKQAPEAAAAGQEARSSPHADAGARPQADSSSALPDRAMLPDYIAQFPELGSLRDLPDDLLDQERRVRQLRPDRSGMPGPLGPASASAGEFRGTDRFLVKRRVGAGGMGVVYEAYDRQRQQIVAIKTMRNVDPGAIYRLKREFRALADLMHPNLVRLHEMFCVSGKWFFTMEFVDGVELLEYVRSERFSRGDPIHSGSFSGTQLTDPNLPVERNSTFKVASARAQTDQSPSQLAKSLDVPQGDNVAASPLTSSQIARLRSALRQIALGVQALHKANKLHRDIKPPNVLVRRDGRLALLDLGVATPLERHEHSVTTGVNLVGTVPYMAPEQAAGKKLTTASDWYSVGVMLYEALTGRRPFTGRSLDVLTAKQESDPPPPSKWTDDVPQDLHDLCVGLLRRDPQSRPSGHDVLRLLGSSADDPPQHATHPDRALETTPFVGREEHLEALGDTFRCVKQGRTVVAYVHGKSGVGKSSLVRRFLDDTRGREEVVVLAGRCYECETVPYKALDSLVDALSHYLMQLPHLEADALLPRDIEALSSVFPVLCRVEAVARSPRREAPASAGGELRDRAFDALRELLGRLGDRKSLAVHIDDLQWADLDSIVLLGDLLRPPDPPVMLLVLGYRTEDKMTGPVPPAIGDLHRTTARHVDVCELEVEPLALDEARQLARALLPDDVFAADDVAEAIARESGGNPYFVDALVRHQASAVEEPARQDEPGLAPNGSAESADAEKPHDSPRVETAKLSDVLWARIRTLPDAARRLLQTLAVAGHPLRQVDACQAAQLDGESHEAVSVLRSVRMIRTGGERLEDEIEVYDDRIRETVVARLDADLIVACHRRLAAALEAWGQADPTTLAAHYVGADEDEKAGRWYARAAVAASQAAAFDRAAVLYQLALKLCPTQQAESRELRRQLADTLASAGRGGDAAVEYLKAARGAAPTEQVELRRHAAEQLLISGHVKQGMTALGTVAAAVGLKLPKSPAAALRRRAVQRALLGLRGFDVPQRDPAEVPAEDARRIDVCWSAAVGSSCINPITASGLQTQGLRLALRSGQPYRIARSLAMEAAHSALAGPVAQRRTGRLLAQADLLARGLDDPYIGGLVTLASGAVACLEGRWCRAVELADEAGQTFRKKCAGLAWEVDTAQFLALSALAWSGQVSELARRLSTAAGAAQRRSDPCHLARLRAFELPPLASDDPRSALRRLVEQHDHDRGGGFTVMSFQHLLARVQIDLYCDRGEAAWRRLTDQWPALVKSRLLRIQLFRGLAYHARARAALAAAAPADGRTNAASSAKARRLLRRAAGDARRLQKENEPWIEPLGVSVRASLAILRNDPAKGRQLLEEAVNRFEAVDMPLPAAAAGSRLGQLLGAHQAADLITRAEARMKAEDVVDPNRMTRLWLPGFPC